MTDIKHDFRLFGVWMATSEKLTDSGQHLVDVGLLCESAKGIKTNQQIRRQADVYMEIIFFGRDRRNMDKNEIVENLLINLAFQWTFFDVK